MAERKKRVPVRRPYKVKHLVWAAMARLGGDASVDAVLESVKAVNNVDLPRSDRHAVMQSIQAYRKQRKTWEADRGGVGRNGAVEAPAEPLPVIVPLPAGDVASAVLACREAIRACGGKEQAVEVIRLL